MVKKKRQSEPGDDCGESTESCEENIPPVCPHINKCVEIGLLKKKIKQLGFISECTDCAKGLNSMFVDMPELTSSVDGSTFDIETVHLLMCLRCGSQLCDRTGRSHALNHYETPRSNSHAIAVNTTTWEVLCFQCKTSFPPSVTKKLHEVVEYVRKQGMATVKANNTEDLNLPDTNTETSQMVTVFDKSLVISASHTIEKDSSPVQRVRGLSNLGNTCFFNSVLQCLVQTPYLTSVLKEMSQPGEKFLLPGGLCKLTVGKGDSGEEQSEHELQLPPISGQLPKWGPLAETLAETLQELQSSGKSDVFNPSKLFRSFVHKHQQFGTGEQHDSHELLRHLLEAVRSEDLRRYQTIVLQELDLDSKEKRSDLDSEKKQKVKFYGQQASDTMLRPEQVFRGFLVSTLECQDCHHSSNREEYFLDLSLPVTAEKPQPPAITRRKGPAPEEHINCLGAPDENKPSKHQLKKEKQAARKLRKSKKGGGNANTSVSDKQNESSPISDVNESKGDKSSSEQSDADVEDNLEENPKALEGTQPMPIAHTAVNFAAYQMESGYNSEKVISSDSIRASPVDLHKDKSDASPERSNKEEKEAGPLHRPAAVIPLPYIPAPTDSPGFSNPDSGVASPETAKHPFNVSAVNVESPVTSKELGSPTSLSSEVNMDMSSPRQSNNSPVDGIERPVSLFDFVESENENPKIGPMNDLDTILTNNLSATAIPLEYKVLGSIDSPTCSMKDSEETARGAISKCSPGLTLNVKENCNDDSDTLFPQWKKETSPFVNRNITISPRYQGDDGEYSIQSCLNQFTSSELLAGNNKVGCEACTKRANTGKTVYTNATKRFLISSPPAVLILHLKRFQIGARCMFRKMSKHVSFPVILDLTPFCSEQGKRVGEQNRLLYSLYGVVEHSGTMHGGHYVAYVKVRPRDQRPSFLPRGANTSPKHDKEPEVLVNGNDDTDSSMSGYESGEVASGFWSQSDSPPGKWFYISDSRVQETSEDKVLRSQAYLLFYERVL